MTHIHRLLLSAGLGGLMAISHAARVQGSAAPQAIPDPCPAAPWTTTERQYKVTARIRPFLVWLGRHDVGDARMTWRESAAPARQLELLIGTDPARAPMHINRWGYIAETLCGGNTSVIGVMTESNEASLAEAQTRVTQRGEGGQPFKAIRASLVAGDAATEVVAITPARMLTYRDLEAVLHMLPPASSPRQSRVEPGAQPGFLAAVADVLHESAATAARSGGSASAVTRTYVYAGRPYDLKATGITVVSDALVAGRRFSRPQRADFTVRSRTTGEVTTFQITYASTGDAAEVPLRIVYQPRWWLQLELELRG